MIKKLINTLFIIFVSFLVFLIPFVIYFQTASKYVQSGDSTEMVTAAITLGIPHQPGYPLNTLIGHQFYKLDYFGLGDVQRVNLTSSFIQALTVFLFYYLMLEVFPQRDSKKSVKIISAFSSSMVLAFSLIFWQYATKFEVFPLNNLFAVLILLIAFKTEKLFKEQKAKVLRILSLIVFSIILGLAVTHHQTIVLIFPAVVLIFWPLIRLFFKKYKEADPLEKRNVIKTESLTAFTFLLCFFVGMSLYFFLIINFSKAHPLMAGGEINNFTGALSTLMRSEYGIFSPYLSMENVARINYPFDQITYYLRNVWSDFSIYGIIFMIAGIIYLLKNNKRLLLIVLTGVSVSGFIFLAYANFPLNDSFNQATVRRFYMLPNIFLVILAGMGIYFVTSYLSLLAGKYKSSTLNFTAVAVVIVGISMINIYINFKNADIKNDNLTELYIEKSYKSVPDGSLVLVSGDVQNMTGEFYTMYENPDTKTMIFTPGRFFLQWYLKNLFESYGNLSLPSPQEGNMFTTTTQIIDANYGKFPIYISYDLLPKDPNIQNDYTLYPSHLLYQVKKKGEEIKLEDWRDENKSIYESLDLEKISEIKSRGPSFEETIIYNFARYFYESGYVYSKVGLWDDAITEYQRSQSLEAYLADNYLGLSEAYANQENPDYASAINYLLQYQNMIYSVDPNRAYEVQSILEQYHTKYNEAYKQEIERQKLEATQSAEVKESSGGAQLEEDL